MKKHDGFTLIEIMIALFIFAIVATMTTTALLEMFNVRNIVDQKNRNLSEIQIALTIMERDIGQMIDRTIMDEGLNLLPSFLQDASFTGIEFTRAGFINPRAEKRRSTLLRIGYGLEEGQLIRKNWNVLDRAPTTEPSYRVLLDNVEDLKWRFLDERGNFLDEWITGKLAMPEAIEIRLTIIDWGEITRLFVIPTYYSSL